jgi:hypothetical protein
LTCHRDTAQDVQGVRAGLLRDFIFETLGPVESDSAAARLCLKHDDDAGARYHLRRVVECTKPLSASIPFCPLKSR